MRGERTSAARWRMLWQHILRGGRFRPLLMGLACAAAVILGALAPLLNASASSALACGLVNHAYNACQRSAIRFVT